MHNSRIMICLFSAASLAACKTNSTGATTKDAIVQTGPGTKTGTPFAIFVNDAANNQMCAIECNDVNPVQIPKADANFANRLKCNIDMICQPAADFFKGYLAISKGANSPSSDQFFNSLLVGFTVYPDQSFADVATALLSQVKTSGKRQPISPALVDRYLTRKASTTFNASSDPNTQRQLDAAQAQLDAAREQQRLADVAEAARQAALAQEQAAAAAKAATDVHVATERGRLQGLASWSSLCPSDDGTSTFHNTAPIDIGGGHLSNEGMDVKGQENNCLNVAFNSAAAGNFAAILIPASDTPDPENLSFLSIDVSNFGSVFIIPPGLGDDVNGFHRTLVGKNAFDVLDKLNVGFTQLDVIDMASFSRATMGDGSAKPFWEIRCELSGASGDSFPRCQIDVNRTVNHQRAVDQAAAQTGEQAATLQQGIQAFANAVQLAGDGTFVNPGDGVNPVSLNFNPVQTVHAFAFLIGPNCAAAGFTLGNVTAALPAGSILTAVNTAGTRADIVTVVFLVNNGNGSLLSQINAMAASGGPCNDVSYFQN